MRVSPGDRGNPHLSAAAVRVKRRFPRSTGESWGWCDGWGSGLLGVVARVDVLGVHAQQLGHLLDDDRENQRLELLT